jgi:DNA polymerase V
MKAIIDCNSFYASCEQVFQPQLRGKPIVVLSNNDGCLIARNDEAKKLGVPMGQPYFMAKELCEKNGVAVFSSNYALYGDLSRRVMHTISTVHPYVEVYSIDEAFLDIDEHIVSDIDSMVTEIRDRVYSWTGIPVSIGVASTKVLSKIANRIAKKNKAHYQGVYILRTSAEIEDALRRTPVDDVWGVGRSSVPKLRYMGIDTAYKLSQMSEAWAHKHMGGIVGVRLIQELNGKPCRQMADGLVAKKNIASTRSFGTVVTQLSELQEAIATYTTRAAEKLRKQNSAANLIYVFAKTDKHDERYQYYSGSVQKVIPCATSSTLELIRYATEAATELFREGNRYKKAGVVLSGIVPDSGIQQHLFEEHKDTAEHRTLSRTMDLINRKLGIDTVTFAANGVTKNWKMRSEVRSADYTTQWHDIPVVR